RARRARPHPGTNEESSYGGCSLSSWKGDAGVWHRMAFRRRREWDRERVVSQLTGAGAASRQGNTGATTVCRRAEVLTEVVRRKCACNLWKQPRMREDFWPRSG